MKRLLTLGITILSGALIFYASSARKNGDKRNHPAAKLTGLQPNVMDTVTSHLKEVLTYSIPKGMAVFVIE